MPEKMNPSANAVKCQPASFRAMPEFLGQTAALLRLVPNFRRELSEQFRHAKNLQKTLFYQESGGQFVS
jgi:hypothetical protein